MTPPVLLPKAGQLAVAAGCLLMLGTAVRAGTIEGVHLALVVCVFVVAAWRPAAGLVVLGLLLPMCHAVTSLIGATGPPEVVAESLVLALIAPLALLAATGGNVPATRLGLPALTMGLIVLASAGCALLMRTGGLSAAGQEMWRHLVAGQMSAGSAVPGIESSLKWLEALGLAAYAELALRRSTGAGRTAWVAFLAAGAGAGAYTVLWVLQSLIASGQDAATMLQVFASTRITVLVPDVNAAGSLFAMFSVATVVAGLLAGRPLLAAVVAPFSVMALLATQSRAALVAACAVFGALAVMRLWRRHRTGAAALLLLTAGATVAVLVIQRPTHVGAGAALSSRLEMSRIALKIAREEPWFGVGAGQFVPASRDYITEDFAASFPEARSGENAHNNFLQVLAEFGLLGFVAFAWLLVRGLRSPPADAADAGIHRAAAAGVLAFLLSALFGHPLLIYFVALNFFLALGLTAGLSSPSSSARLGLTLAAAVIGVTLVTLPWRVSAILSPVPDVRGAGSVAGTLDGVEYRAAEQVSHWRVRARSRHATFPLRWDGASAKDCRVQVHINGRLIDEVAIAAEVWTDVRFAIAPSRRPAVAPEFELRVSHPSCRLLVGPITAGR